MFEVGKKYKSTNLKGPRECIAIHKHGKYGWLESPQFAAGFIAEWGDDWTECLEPLTVSGWVNVYPGPARREIGYGSKEKADAEAIPGRIACIYVSGTEGIEPGYKP